MKFLMKHFKVGEKLRIRVSETGLRSDCIKTSKHGVRMLHNNVFRKIHSENERAEKVEVA